MQPSERSGAIDQLIAGLLADQPPERSARLLALLANRAAARLHGLARGEAAARRGDPDWGAWAGLQNAARTLVLQTSTARDLAERLPGEGQN